jgi:hypothetical protein
MGERLGRLVVPRDQRDGGRPAAIFRTHDRQAAIIAQRRITAVPAHDRGEHRAVTAEEAAQTHVRIHIAARPVEESACS